MAPKSDIVGIKVLDQKGDGKVTDVLNALQWVEQHKEEYRIRIVNISIGTVVKEGVDEQSALVRAVDHAWDSGLVVVVAAGNLGPKAGSITTPGISRKVITVGSSDDNKVVSIMGNRIVHYSGRGPTKACICKPDIVAPGSNITSCKAAGYYRFLGRNNAYTVKSGTSMATPIVSGAIALLLSKYPWMTNLEVKMKLKEAVTDLGLPRNQQGLGLLNVERLMNLY